MLLFSEKSVESHPHGGFTNPGLLLPLVDLEASGTIENRNHDHHNYLYHGNYHVHDDVTSHELNRGHWRRIHSFQQSFLTFRRKRLRDGHNDENASVHDKAWNHRGQAHA